MSIQIDNNQFTILVKKYLDDRQYIKTLEELNNVDVNRFPAGLITYCEEDKCLYKRNIDNTWTRVDTAEAEPFLFIYEEDEDGLLYPDEEQPIYAKVTAIPFEEMLLNFINKEEYANLEAEGIFVSLEINTDEDKMYSQSSIDVQILQNDQAGKDYLTKRLLELVKPGFEEVSDVTEMVDSGTFYLLESILNPGEYAMYIIDETGTARPLGSKQMSLSNYQHLEDERLETESKNLVEGINELNVGLKKNNTIIGNLDSLKIDSNPNDVVEGLNYCQFVLNRLGNIKDLNIIKDETDTDYTFIKAINTLDSILGALNRLTTINRNSLVASLNSFYGVNVPAGSIFPYVGKTPPEGYLLCDGEEYELSKYPELYTAIGFNFGLGTTSTKFRVPDLRKRIIVGFDENDEDFNTVGKIGGSETVVLQPENLPRHAHTISSTTHTHRVYAYSANANVTYAKTGSDRDSKNSGYSTSTTAADLGNSTFNHTHTFTSGWQYHYHDMLKTGSTDPAPHENRQPFMYTNFIIKY